MTVEGDGHARASRRVQIAPSILASDFLRLGQEVEDAERAGADRLPRVTPQSAIADQAAAGGLGLRKARCSTRWRMVRTLSGLQAPVS